MHTENTNQNSRSIQLQPAFTGKQQASEPATVKGFDCPTMGRISFEDCLAHAKARRGVPECGFGLPTLAAIIDGYTQPNSELTDLAAANPYTLRVTTVTSPCAREAVLKIVKPIEYVSPEQSYWLTRGTLYHLLKEKYAPENASVAPRLAMPVEIVADVPGIGLVEVEVVVTGQEDSAYFWQSPEGNEEETQEATLFDYKSTAMLPYSPKPEHLAQVSLYNELRRQNGLPTANRIAINYFSMSGERIFEAEPYTPDELQAYLTKKITPIIEALLAMPTNADAYAEDTDEWLPKRIDPLNKEIGWKCSYCNYSSYCWPTGVPGAEAKAQAKRAANGAARRTYYAVQNKATATAENTEPQPHEND